jgi:hypothetical protein
MNIIISNGDWGLGIGDWGLGIGDWAQSPIPNPQSPIPIIIWRKKNNFLIIILNKAKKFKNNLIIFIDLSYHLK